MKFSTFFKYFPIFLILITGCALKNFSGWQEDIGDITNVLNKSVNITGHIDVNGGIDIKDNITTETGDSYINFESNDINVWL